MKKISVFTLFVILSGCSINDARDFVLKHTNKSQYIYEQNLKQCHTYDQNRRIQVDGVADYYQYNSNNMQNCELGGFIALEPAQEPNRYAKDRADIVPLTK